MTGHIVERFLGDAIEHRAPRRVQLFHCRKSCQMDMNAGPRAEALHEGMQGGNKSEIIQDRRAQFAGEPVYDVHRLLHQPLRAGDFAV